MLFRKKKQEAIKNSRKELKSEYLAEKSKPVEEATFRTVHVKALVECGCGGSYEKFTIDVASDSDISNGDYVGDIYDYENVREGWV